MPGLRRCHLFWRRYPHHGGEGPGLCRGLAVEDGKIAFVGARDEAMAMKSDATRAHRPQGPHAAAGLHRRPRPHDQLRQEHDRCRSVQLRPAWPDVVARMKAHAATCRTGEWIVGFGYQARKPAGKPHADRGGTRPGFGRPAGDDRRFVRPPRRRQFRAVQAGGHHRRDARPGGRHLRPQAGRHGLAGPMEETALNAVRLQRPPFTGARPTRW